MTLLKLVILVLLLLTLVWVQFSLGMHYFGFLAVSLSCILVFFGVSAGTLALGFVVSFLTELGSGIPVGTTGLTYGLLVLIFYLAKNAFNMNLNQDISGWLLRQSFVATLLSCVYLIMSVALNYLLHDRNLPILSLNFLIYNIGVFSFVYALLLLYFIKKLFGNLYKFGSI